MTSPRYGKITYQALEVRSVCVREKVVDQTIEEELSLFLAQNLSHGSSVLVFMSRITSDKVLEVQVAAQSGTF